MHREGTSVNITFLSASREKDAIRLDPHGKIKINVNFKEEETGVKSGYGAKVLRENDSLSMIKYFLYEQK